MQYSVLLDRLQKLTNHKPSKANNKAMLEAAKQNQNNLEYARQHAWEVPQGFFDNIRNQIQKSPIPDTDTGLRKEGSLMNKSKG